MLPIVKSMHRLSQELRRGKINRVIQGRIPPQKSRSNPLVLQITVASAKISSTQIETKLFLISIRVNAKSADEASRE